MFSQPSSSTATTPNDPGSSSTIGAASSTTSATAEEPPLSRGSFDIPDELIAEAIAEAANSPLEGLAGRDSLTTARLTSELTGAGFDLTGMDVTVYWPGAAPGIVVVTTDDAAPLINDDAAGEGLLTSLTASSALDDAGVDRLLMQHSTSDDQGPLLITMTVLLSDLAESAATGSDVSDIFAVQAERL